MPDFIEPDCDLTTGEIAVLTRATLREGDPPDRRISNIAPKLDSAGPSDISVFSTVRNISVGSAGTRAGACLIAPRFAAAAPPGLAVLETPHPYPSFVAVARKLFPAALRPSSLFGTTGRAATAQVRILPPGAEAGVTVDLDGGHRTARRNRRRHADCRRRDCRSGCPHWARLRDRCRHHNPACIDRRSRDHPCRHPYRPRRFRLSAKSARPSENPANAPRHHPGRCGNRRQLDGRSWIDPRYDDRRGNQDRQSRPKSHTTSRSGGIA